jgi:MFS family permease
MIAISGLLGALFGSAAGIFYAALGPGAFLGAVYGLAMGVVWDRWPRLRSANRYSSGVGVGALAGVLVSCLVHTSLELWFGFRDALGKQFFGLVFGLVAGGLMGLLGGVGWRMALSRKRERTHPRSAAVDDLSAAVVVVMGFRTRSSPTRDYAVLAKLCGETRARELASQVQTLLSELDGMQVDWGKHDLASAGDEAIRFMASRHPELTKEALEALAWTFTFSWR